jgi:hypothetical protein
MVCSELIFEDKLTTEEEVIQQISKNIQEYKSCALINSKSETMQQHPIVSNHSRSRTIKWKKPSLNLYKVNTDANLSQEGIWGLGAICRNSSGDVLAAATWKREGANEPTEAEAFAIYSAMEFAAQSGFFDVIFETDSEKLVRYLTKEEIPNVYLGNIVRGIQLRKAWFRQVSFMHIGRKGNKAPHKLA